MFPKRSAPPEARWSLRDRSVGATDPAPRARTGCGPDEPRRGTPRLRHLMTWSPSGARPTITTGSRTGASATGSDTSGTSGRRNAISWRNSPVSSWSHGSRTGRGRRSQPIVRATSPCGTCASHCGRRRHSERRRWPAETGVGRARGHSPIIHIMSPPRTTPCSSTTAPPRRLDQGSSPPVHHLSGASSDVIPCASLSGYTWHRATPGADRSQPSWADVTSFG